MVDLCSASSSTSFSGVESGKAGADNGDVLTGVSSSSFRERIGERKLLSLRFFLLGESGELGEAGSEVVPLLERNSDKRFITANDRVIWSPTRCLLKEMDRAKACSSYQHAALH